MFDISWSEILILGVVALIVVGPKELPVLLRTLGRYAGMARRQAAEFRGHFDDAMREAEMADLRKEMDSVRREVMSSARGVKEAASAPLEDAGRVMSGTVDSGAAKAGEAAGAADAASAPAFSKEA